MPPGIQIIERIENDLEALKKLDVELGVFDVCVVGFELYGRIELRRGLFRNLIDGSSALMYMIKCLTIRVLLTNAFGFLMCSCRNRNWRFKLLRSMVSRSTIWTSPKPVRTRFLRSSHPIPPAPTIKTRDLRPSRRVSQTFNGRSTIQHTHLFDSAVERAERLL